MGRAAKAVRCSESFTAGARRVAAPAALVQARRQDAEPPVASDIDLDVVVRDSLHLAARMLEMPMKAAMAAAADDERLRQRPCSYSNSSSTVSPADPSVSITMTPLIEHLPPGARILRIAPDRRHCGRGGAAWLGVEPVQQGPAAVLSEVGAAGAVLELRLAEGSTLTPSPKMSSPSTITSPTLMPTRKSMRLSTGMSALRSSMPRWISTTERPPCSAILGSIRALRSDHQDHRRWHAGGIRLRRRRRHSTAGCGSMRNLAISGWGKSRRRGPVAITTGIVCVARRAANTPGP